MEVPVERLRRRCNPDEFGFETTAEVEPLTGTIGQDRAVEAIEFGLEIRNHDYHMYVAGPKGTGKRSSVQQALEGIAARQAVPHDWVYVTNFDDPYRPTAIPLPAGMGNRFQKDMETFVEGCKQEIPRAFESENYEQQRSSIMHDIQSKREEVFHQLQADAQREGFLIEMTPVGIVTVPIIAGRPLSREEFDTLPEPKKREVHERSEHLQSEIGQSLSKIRKFEKEASERTRKLDKEIALFAVGHLIEDMHQRYRESPKVLDFLNRVQDDIIENIDHFRSQEKPPEPLLQLAQLEEMSRAAVTERYQVNLFINHADTNGAPVVFEQNPTYYNLFGRIDFKARFGAMVTDVSLIKPGSIHRANGGYLIIQAMDLLTSFLSWDTLKRILRDGEGRIENIGEQYSAFPTTSLKPEPVPIDVKIILVGNPWVYHLLHNYDEDFRKYFKVKADFDSEMDFEPSNLQKLSGYVAAKVRESHLLPFHRTGVARLAEYAARLNENQNKMSAQLSEIGDLATEASFWATKSGAQAVTDEHVQHAIDKKRYRSSLVEDRIHELIQDDTILISTEGGIVGQANGLSVQMMGDYMFGRPSRITARTAIGRHGLVNVEREIKLSGKIHSKGVLIIAGYLNGKYAQKRPLALSASLTFEQLYDEVEGDSASSTELYTILSSLSGLPLKQNLAITGSVNQRGEIQPIGGVTHKIEGFYRVCKAKGLTGEQGVIIPESNIKHLMLEEEVIEAVRQGRFHIYAIKTIDEGIELLTGVPAGSQLPDGTWEPGTVHALVDQKLGEYAKLMQAYSEEGKKEETQE
ncbi:MAG: Lon protease family protein [Bacteroidota bacterium]